MLKVLFEFGGKTGRFLFMIFFWVLLQYSSSQGQCSKTISFSYLGNTYSYCASFSNAPGNTYGTYFSSHPTTSAVKVDETIDGHYNCHAFAFANDKTVWVTTGGGNWDTDPPMIYFSKGYYVQVTNEKDAELAVYGNPAYPTHSAVRLTNSSNTYGAQAFAGNLQYAGWYISKWDGGQLVIHPLTDCPYSGPVTFYKKAIDNGIQNNIKGDPYSIAGPKIVCSSGASFTLNCGTPKSFTVTWSASSNITLPANPTAYPITVTANGSSKGTGWVKARLNFNDGTFADVAQYNVWVGAPDNITSVSDNQWAPGPGTSHTYAVPQYGAYFYAWPFNGEFYPPSATYPDTHGVTAYNWVNSNESVFTQTNPGARYVRGTFSNIAYCVMTINASNACGSVQYPQSFRISATGTLKVGPNPASSEVTITVLGTENDMPLHATTANAKYVPKASGALSPTANTYSIRLLDLTGAVRYTVRKQGKQFTIPVDKLPDGVYLLEVNDGQNVRTEKLLVQH